jgi:hypothetical protein
MTTRANTTRLAGVKKRKPNARKGWKPKFLAALRESGIVFSACKVARIDRREAYRAKDADTAFASQWDEAIADATDALEAEAIRRGEKGVLRGIYWQGKRVDDVLEYSDGLLQFILKARNPARFRDNFSIEHTGKDGGPIEHRDTRTAEEQELAIEKLLELRSRSDVRAGK